MSTLENRITKNFTSEGTFNVMKKLGDLTPRQKDIKWKTHF